VDVRVAHETQPATGSFFKEARQQAQATMREIRRLRPRHLGFVFFWSWMGLFMHFSHLFDGSASTATAIVPSDQLPLLVLTITSALTMLAAGTLVPQRFAPLTTRPGVHISAAAFVTVGFLLYVFGGGLNIAGINVATVIAPGIAGIGLVHHMLIWGEFYGSVGSRRAAIYMTLTILCAVVLTAVVRLLPRELALLTVCLYPVFSSLLARRNGDEVKRHQALVVTEQSRTNAPRYLLPLPWKICVVAGFYGMVSSLVSSSAVYIEATRRLPLAELSQTADIVVATLLLLGVLFFGRNLDRGFTYRPTLLVMVAGCVLLPFIETMQGAIAVGIVSGGYMYFYALSWTLYADATYRLRLTGFKVFAWGRVFGALGYAAGMLINFVLVTFDQASILRPDVLSLITMVLLIATSIFVLDERNVTSGWGRSFRAAQVVAVDADGVGAVATGVAVDGGAAAEMAGALPATTLPATPLRADGGSVVGVTATGAANGGANRESLLERNCALLSDAHRLTKREREVLDYLARGRSLAWIERALQVSYSTVNTHVANIYHKLDVHSRQELLDRVEAPRPLS
jgi:DNA-binding CsgD family transcriptional regulator